MRVMFLAFETYFERVEAKEGLERLTDLLSITALETEQESELRSIPFCGKCQLGGFERGVHLANQHFLMTLALAIRMVAFSGALSR